MSDTFSLVYVSDNIPGYYRRKRGKYFSYVDDSGKLVHQQSLKERFKALVIPPAWREVWISPVPNSHLQVTGLDIKGRKQYIYHSQWSKKRNETKFSMLPSFAKALPKIREQAKKDLNRRKLDKKKVLAALVFLMEKSKIRIGNKEYEKENNSFGLTTLHDRHVHIHGEEIDFEFVGKKGIRHAITLSDKKLAHIVKRCKDIPGYQLFQYYDKSGIRHCITSEDVNAYIKEISGKEFTAKDFRTWAGTLSAFQEFKKLEPGLTFNLKKQQVVEVIKKVAKILGNTPSICRKYYIHPTIIEAFLEKVENPFGYVKAGREEKALMEFLKGQTL